MEQIQNNIPAYIQQGGTPLYNYASTPQTVNNPIQQGLPAGVQPVYQYPVTSLYGSNQTPQQASGVNINIYNPSGLGNMTSPVYTNGASNVQPIQPVQQSEQPVQQPAQFNAAQQINTNNKAEEPVANSPIKTEEQAAGANNQKMRNVVDLSDDYIKSLENFIRSNDATTRKSGITQLIKRYEEDVSRYDDPALTALLNISLQDKDAANRMLAMSVIASGNAHGDENTVNLLQNLTKSEQMYGQEAKMATEALLNTAQAKTEVADNSAYKQ